jgi:hypothetical protein
MYVEFPLLSHRIQAFSTSLAHRFGEILSGTPERLNLLGQPVPSWVSAYLFSPTQAATYQRLAIPQEGLLAGYTAVQWITLVSQKDLIVARYYRLIKDQFPDAFLSDHLFRLVLLWLSQGQSKQDILSSLHVKLLDIQTDEVALQFRLSDVETNVLKGVSRQHLAAAHVPEEQERCKDFFNSTCYTGTI